MNYKPVDGLSYYFLDSFDLDISTNKKITPIFIELDNHKKFTNFDVTQNGHEDIAIGDAISVKTINDKEDKFDKKGDYSKMYYDWKGRYKQYNPTQTCPVEQIIPNKSVGVKQESDKGGRGGPIEQYSGITASPLQQDVQHKDGHSLYAPDTYEKCESRYNVLKEFYRNKIESFVVHSFNELHPESIRFDRIYNLDIHAPGSYKYLPISIVNEFRKWNSPEANYKQVGYVNFLKYI
jgi:hypothetical protein